MTDYRLFETEQFRRDLRTISRGGHQAVVQKLRRVVYPQLRQHPHMGPHIRRLKGFEPPTWRYRIGAWRFFYEGDEQQRIVFLHTAALRSAAYR
ncbi:MAG: type II toxin-antitoxin system RelE/ParE family toxin [Holophagales bacterium]|nr:type II toxin-antitoxin system RelE/ParE family toxin [Holophagales bacterium]